MLVLQARCLFEVGVSPGLIALLGPSTGPVFVVVGILRVETNCLGVVGDGLAQLPLDLPYVASANVNVGFLRLKPNNGPT
jgi:hypothetical protein